ncbi:acetyl-CoA acetyltransferase [Nocardia jinanensis]|uniref:Thiolase n=1 Tax=Nocardia jinanensis TaxID=382504 RepID=A0A917RN46_9NOCA|nr:acetyl-CoA acetyltransferase [Nocardia jinanensis]GGL15040.1 thiolase [Nocardia jinanensis]
MTNRRVALAGVALSDCGRVPDKTRLQLIQQASRDALADAGLRPADVQGFGSVGTTLPPIEVSEYLGLRPTWCDSTNVGGAAWEVMAQHAAAAIAQGEIDVALLAYGSTARSDVRRKRRTGNMAIGSAGPLQFDAPYGHTLISKYAMAARRHMHEFGTTIEQLAEVAVSARRWAALNPLAFARDPLTIDDVQSARMMADPYTQLHCCLRTDGGGAVVLVAEELARDSHKKPVWILGSSHALSHTTMSEWADFTESPCAVSGPSAFARAGVTPEDIDVCQIYDSFTGTVLVTLEGLGFCKKGEGGEFVADGRLRPGGSFPINTDGGGLSSCHPGMRGMFLMVEAVRQLRGECGPRQVPDARLACVNATGGWFSSAATMILGTD